MTSSSLPAPVPPPAHSLYLPWILPKAHSSVCCSGDLAHPLFYFAGVYPCWRGGGPGVKAPSLTLQQVRGKRKQRQLELKFSQPNTWQEAGLFCNLCEV